MKYEFHNPPQNMEVPNIVILIVQYTCSSEHTTNMLIKALNNKHKVKVHILLSIEVQHLLFGRLHNKQESLYVSNTG